MDQRDVEEGEKKDKRNWYAIRVFNNHIFRIKEELDSIGVQTYMALKKAVKPGMRTVQLAPSLLFVRWDAERLSAFKQKHFNEIMVYRKAEGTEPAVIGEKEMEMFMLVTSALGGMDVEVTDRVFDFQQGERVRVTEGPFKGAEGIVKRIKKDRKLLIEVSGVVVVAVSHIPGQFLERI